ncbi:MAG: insulinase family protein [Deltaproteobacteria bacterium]|nr:insulinase family protein [Deltaproteobacteria bacterium]
MASRFGFLKFVLNDLNYDNWYIDQLKQVEVKQFKDMLKKYFISQRMSGVFLLPKTEGAFELSEIQKLIKETLWQKSADSVSVKTSKSQHKSQHYDTKRKLPELIKTSSGIKLLFQEKPLSHVISIQAAVLGGLRLELGSPLENKATDWGVSHLMSLTWAKGTQSKNAREISSLVEGHAAGLEGFSGRNTVGLSLTCLSRDWQVLAPLFTEVLIHPTFPEDELVHYRRFTEEEIRSIDDHSSQICSKQFLETLYETHPYGYWATGSLESVSKLSHQKLNSFHKAWVTPERLVISVVGAISRTEIETWLAKLEAEFSKISELTSKVVLPQNLPEENLLTSPRWVEKKIGREQCHILIGGLGIPMLSKDRHALRILQTVLGGQSGRLFLELREKQSLAYSVNSVSFEGIEKGYIGTYLACAPEKQEQATRSIKEVLKKIAQKGPTDKELDRAIQYFLGKKAMELQSDSALASYYCLQTLYELSIEEDINLSNTLKKIKTQDLKKVCEKYLVEPYMVTSVVS